MFDLADSRTLKGLLGVQMAASALGSRLSPMVGYLFLFKRILNYSRVRKKRERELEWATSTIFKPRKDIYIISS